MFKNYQSKTIIRMAMQITEHMRLFELTEKETTMQCVWKDETGDAVEIEFKYNSPVAIGDYIIHRNDDDVYHCPAEAFDEGYTEVSTSTGTAKDRVVEELSQLSEKGAALTEFKTTDKFKSLSKAQQRHLRMQLQAMQAYGEILIKRLESWE